MLSRIHTVFLVLFLITWVPTAKAEGRSGVAVPRLNPLTMVYNPAVLGWKSKSVVSGHSRQYQTETLVSCCSLDTKKISAARVFRGMFKPKVEFLSYSLNRKKEDTQKTYTETKNVSAYTLHVAYPFFDVLSLGIGKREHIQKYEYSKSSSSTEKKSTRKYPREYYGVSLKISDFVYLGYLSQKRTWASFQQEKTVSGTTSYEDYPELSFSIISTAAALVLGGSHNKVSLEYRQDRHPYATATLGSKTLENRAAVAHQYYFDIQYGHLYVLLHKEFWNAEAKPSEQSTRKKPYGEEDAVHVGWADSFALNVAITHRKDYQENIDQSSSKYNWYTSYKEYLFSVGYVF